MGPKDADGMANSVKPHQTALGLHFAQAYLSENLGSLWYTEVSRTDISRPCSIYFHIIR